MKIISTIEISYTFLLLGIGGIGGVGIFPKPKEGGSINTWLMTKWMMWQNFSLIKDSMI